MRSIIFLIPLGLAAAALIIYANVRRWHDLSRMTPDERALYKQQEREDLRVW